MSQPTTAPQASKKGNGTTAGASDVIRVFNPVTGEVIAELPRLGEPEIIAMVAKAREAFPRWSALPFSERAEVMYRWRELTLDRLDEGLDILCEESGKARGDAMADFLSTFATISYYGKKGEKFISDRRKSPFLAKSKSVYVSYKPIGVGGIISPWNFPYDLAVGEAVPGLLSGCTIILKPTEITPMIAVWAQKLFREAGGPEGVFQVATGDGQTGAALVRHVDRLTFTGSTATGRKVAAVCGERLIPFTLELGGKDAMIVCDDADIDRAAGGAVFGAFFNAGQMCTSVERCYVHESVYDEFVDKVVTRAKQVRLQPEGDRPQDIGSLTFPPQIDTVEAHLEDAKKKGARILMGGNRRPDLGPLYFEPTVLVDVDHSMLCMKDETFGPTLPIMKVSSDEEAIRLANDSTYGLNSAVWSKSADRARSIARRLQVGTTEINDAATSHLCVESPFGGVKSSGVGRRRGPDGIRKYCQPQTVVRDLLNVKSEMWWYPLPPSTPKLMRKAFALLFRRTWSKKLSG
jgi:acyl-CoA reductase-like NAD-dependent aldehyde dehydrogenase